jgi:DNA-binding NtrC family response regulator
MDISILVVDDEHDFLDSVKRILNMDGYNNVTLISKPETVPEILNKKIFHIAFLDITMPVLDGLSLLKIIKENSPETECIMVTANEEISKVIRAIKSGAYDYLIKPILPDQILHSLKKALERKRLLESLHLKSETALSKSLKNPQVFSNIITSNDKMIKILHETELHAVSEIPVLITGETGVGKELLAKSVHYSSKRAKKPFVAVNMLALSPSLFESEFFGHGKGAFTGAISDKAGYLEKAKEGTLFLDEIGDLTLDIQGKLLRILQEGEFIPVGKTKAIFANVRFIAATNQNLELLVKQNKFRKDLFYRLQFAHLHIVPLRKRLDDIPLLAEHFLGDNTLSPESEALLKSYDWPGNIRELQGVLEAAQNLSQGKPIAPKHLRINKKRVSNQIKTNLEVDHLKTLSEIEKEYILKVYLISGNNKSKTARLLDIGLQTLHRKLKLYNVK